MHSLFIPASKPDVTGAGSVWRFTRKLLLSVIGAMLLLAVADPIAGFFVKQYFPEPPSLLNDFPNSHGLDAFWAMVDQGKHPIVFTGSSTTFYGINPHFFDESIKQLTGQDEIS